MSAGQNIDHLEVPRMPIPIPQRDSYIPEWAHDWQKGDLDRQVYHEGKPMGFKLGQVLPERRWAFERGPTEIETRQQHDFIEDYKRWITLCVDGDGKVKTAEAVISPADEHLPLVQRFVNYRWTADNRRGPIFAEIPKPRGLDAQEQARIREEIVQAAKASGAEPVPEETEGEKVACGKSVKRGYTTQHESRCNDCKAIALSKAQHAGAGA